VVVDADAAKLNAVANSVVKLNNVDNNAVVLNAVANNVVNSALKY
jgi:hypothetical protein